MQSRNPALNSGSSKNTNGFSENAKSTSLNRNNDDYLDIVLRKEIYLWFQKNASSENAPSIVEPTNGFPEKMTSSVIALGYGGD